LKEKTNYHFSVDYELRYYIWCLYSSSSNYNKFVVDDDDIYIAIVVVVIINLLIDDDNDVHSSSINYNDVGDNDHVYITVLMILKMILEFVSIYL